ncbi:hypothetical protein RRG08_004627 [Elysia crispata]|uniref:Uncharacterized protein n=1 Tax=Elysia crispata TaxID=231223 RepID=A0AAE1CW12_9GAST|nr:hypothetical protein RRG08_004627 [Elysia crispata]
MGLDVHAPVAHTVPGQTDPVITSVGNVIKVVTLDTMETDVPGPAAVTVQDLTISVTVLVELVRQAVNQGTEDQSVLNDVTETDTVNNVGRPVVYTVKRPPVTMSTGLVTMAVTLVTMVLYVHRVSRLSLILFGYYIVAGRDVSNPDSNISSIL